ncbi:MAG: kelch repeat-containing protein [Deltaproteobacteria bacterium]|nr:kelch repeat-containing protein [Deltaproteobacteria bacterium]
MAYPRSISPRPGAFQRCLRALLGAALLLFGEAGCARDVGDLNLLIVRSPVVQEEPLDPELVKWLGIRAEGPGMGVRTLEEPFVQGETSRLPHVEVGPERTLQLEGRVSEGGAVVSRGRSVPLEILPGRTEVELFVGLVGRFSTSSGGPLLEPRGEAHLLPVAPGLLFLVGGREAPGGALPGALEAFDPTRGERTISGDCRGGGFLCLRWPRTHHAALPAADGVLVLGGADDTGLIGEIERCTVAGCSVWGTLDEPRRDPAAAPSGEARGGGGFLVGGEGSTGPLPSVDRVVADGRLVPAPPLPSARTRAAAAVAGDGTLVVFGGLGAAGTALPGAVRLRADATSFELVEGAADAGRADAVAVTLPDGRVLFVGGRHSDGTPSDEVDLYDPEAGAICPVGTLRRPLADHSVSPLPHGGALVAGGLGAGEAVTNEVSRLDTRFVPSGATCATVRDTLEVAPAGRLRHARHHHAAATAANGLVVVAGGYGETGEGVGTIEVYVP